MDEQQTQRQRTVLRISGEDRLDFLQGLVTNDVKQLANGPVYAALLTPQGKYMADFLLIPDGDTVLMDLDAAQAPGVAQKLGLYKLRAAVSIEDTDLQVERGLGDAPDGAVADPRDPGLGWRRYGTTVETAETTAALEARRIELGIPQSGVELVPGESYILELGFEALNGVDFRKGCYVGQEIVARMKHKTQLRKGLRRVTVSQPVAVGTEVLAGDKSVGTLYSQSGGTGIAFLRFDRIGADMQAGAAQVSVIEE